MTDPKGPASGSNRMFRGGSYLDNGWDCRAAGRIGNSPDSSGSNVGFRPVLAPSQP